MLDTIPTFLLDIITFLIFLLFFELGYLIGKRRDYNNVKKSDAVISPATAGILGLFAFLIAFTFNLSAQKLDTRKQNVLLEANAIGTAHLRADLLQDPYKSRIKDLLREYTDVRLKIAAAMEDEATEYLARSLELQDLLWDEAVTASKEANDAATKLVIESLNEVFDMHSNRVAASIYNRIAGNIWLMLFIVGSLGILMSGIQNGVNGPKRYIAIIPLILAFTVVFALIEDMDNPRRGMFKVGQQPMLDVKKSISE
ncbi:hypothetical protein ACLHDG_08890 [Sulfurovum sp. CS9]|uniref:bestrophin-like domain n=1 Tax=Sulfurovum sp. CS9 TaxID=3391146 RepID=UPI0039E8040E